MVQVKQDLTGQKFGRLTVIEQSEDWIIPTTQKHIPMWHCKCECGNELNVRGADSKNGTTSSCGCLKRDIHIKPNKYNLSGEYGIGYTVDGREFYFDLDDYDKIRDKAWHINQQGYVVTRKGHKGRRILLHRFIMEIEDIQDVNIIVDHKNHNKVDNRKNNIRVCTALKNGQNKKPRNRELYTGIYKYEYNGKYKHTIKYKVEIRVNGIIYRLGKFDTYEDALKTRKDAEKKYYGEFAYSEN